MNTLDRFWSKVDVRGPDECWPWLRYIDTYGYGQFGVRHPMRVKSHRFAYEALVGAIPDGLVLDHLCRNRACCNPAHLEPVTTGENTRRAHALQTHCKSGHEFSPENTYLSKRGGRECRACKREWMRARRGTTTVGNAFKVECIRGHSLTDPVNVRVDANGRRHCRACRRLSAERRKREQAA